MTVGLLRILMGFDMSFLVGWLDLDNVQTRRLRFIARRVVPPFVKFAIPLNMVNQGNSIVCTLSGSNTEPIVVI